MIVPFKAEHLEQMDQHDTTSFFRPHIKLEQLKLLEQSGMAYTAIKDGRVLGCAGVVEYWPDRGEVWAVFDKKIQHDFVYIHKAALRFLDTVPIRRIEAAVEFNFVAGHRWIRMLGFELEAVRMHAYVPSGADFSLYARVK